MSTANFVSAKYTPSPRCLTAPLVLGSPGGEAGAAFVGFLLALIQFERAFVMIEDLGGVSVHIRFAKPLDRLTFIRDLFVLINELLRQLLAFFAQSRPTWWNRVNGTCGRRERTVAAGLALAKLFKLPRRERRQRPASPWGEGERTGAEG